MCCLRADGASLEMKATDLDLEINESTPAMVERGGATTVPAHLLYDIVRKLPDGGEVSLSVNADRHIDERRVGPLEFPPAMPAAVGFPGADLRHIHPFVPHSRRASSRA